MYKKLLFFNERESKVPRIENAHPRATVDANKFKLLFYYWTFIIIFFNRVFYVQGWAEK